MGEWGLRQLQALQICDMPLHDLLRAIEIPRQKGVGEVVAGFEAASLLLVGEAEAAVWPVSWATSRAFSQRS